jgi:hypothetical protein
LPKHDELLALTDRAQQGDKTALPALREVLKDPAAVNLLGGDLAYQAQVTLIDRFSGKNLLFKESLRRKLELLRGRGGRPDPDAVGMPPGRARGNDLAASAPS